MARGAERDRGGGFEMEQGAGRLGSPDGVVTDPASMSPSVKHRSGLDRPWTPVCSLYKRRPQGRAPGDRGGECWCLGAGQRVMEGACPLPTVSAASGSVPTLPLWHGAQRQHGAQHPQQLPRHAHPHGQVQPAFGGRRAHQPQDGVGPQLCTHPLTVPTHVSLMTSRSSGPS